MRKWIRRDYKIVHLVRAVSIILLIPIILTLIYINRIAVKQTHAKVLSDEQASLDVWMDNIDQNLQNSVLVANELVIKNPDVIELENASSDAERYYAMVKIQSTLMSYARLDFGIDEFFFYSEAAGRLGFLTTNIGTSDNSLNRYLMNNRIKSIITSNVDRENFNGWFFEQVGDTQYLVYLIKNEDNFAGVWSTTESLVAPIEENFEESRTVFVVDQDGVSRDNAYLQNQTLKMSSNSYLDANGKVYMQLHAASAIASFFLMEHIDEHVLIGSLVTVQNVMIILGVLILLLLMAFQVSFEKLFYRPLRRFVAKMVAIAGGEEFDPDQGRTWLREVRIVNEIFDDLVDELKSLRIRAYEEKLDEQEVELQYLHTQIRPHFLVNTLNMLYSMAGMRQFDSIQRTSLYLVQYYRYLYRKSYMVSLSDELEHVACYLKIQETRFPKRFTYSCEIAPGCGQQKVPSLMIQTFIENSFKYGINLDRMNNISVRADLRKDSLVITIADEGPGYPDLLLEQVNHDAKAWPKNRESVGIFNVKRRLELIYAGDANLLLANDNGALATIEIPIS